MAVPTLMHIACYLHILHCDATGFEASACTCPDHHCMEIVLSQPKPVLRKLIKLQKLELYKSFTSWIDCQRKPELACDEVVCWVINQHRQYVIDNGKCRRGLEHEVLYMAARLAIKFRLRRRRAIIELLGDIYRCEGCFDRIMLGAINGPSRSLAEWFNREECLRALRLFLEHSSKAGMQFYCNGKFWKMVDVPLSSGEFAIYPRCSASLEGKSNGRLQPLEEVHYILDFITQDNRLMNCIMYCSNVQSLFI